jgi:hypothetical protein
MGNDMAILKTSSQFLKQCTPAVQLIKDTYGDMKELRHLRGPCDTIGEGPHWHTFYIEVPGYKPSEEFCPAFIETDDGLIMEIDK